jgi:hypothetical protein
LDNFPLLVTSGFFQFEDLGAPPAEFFSMRLVGVFAMLEDLTNKELFPEKRQSSSQG